MKLLKLDPRVKLFIMAGFSTAALITRIHAALIALLLMVIFILLAGGVRPGAIWTKLRGMFSLILALFLLQCLFNRNGEVLCTVSKLTIVTDLGLKTAAMISLRLLIVILSALVVSTGEARDYLLSLTSLKIPYEIAFMVLAALRFLPILREEARDVLCAAQMRGLQIKNAGLKRRAGAYLSIMIPVAAGAIRRAEQLSIAMEARGFRAFPRRTNMRRLRMCKTDWIFIVVFCAAVTAVLLWNA